MVSWEVKVQTYKTSYRQTAVAVAQPSRCEEFMNVGSLIDVTGYVTQEKFIVGRTLAEVEKILGYHAGRLAHGMALAALFELPTTQQFDLAGYSYVAAHRFQTPMGLDVNKLKDIARTTWATTGLDRLVKVLPIMRHDPNMKPDIQYPPGQGAPQWVCKIDLRAKITVIVCEYPGGRCLEPLGSRTVVS